uniref:Uncharacterized protein n=1 Tax=Timema bartmani TaxID=61472 RepID=A0A7R9I5B6_9NEOP|nr:unnamed protein product [Timema bartmani]
MFILLGDIDVAWHAFLWLVGATRMADLSLPSFVQHSIYVVSQTLSLSVDIHQLNLIMELLGTPRDEFMQKISSESELGNEELQELAQNPSPESDSEEDKPSHTFTMKSMATAFHRIQEGLQMLADEDPDVERSARVHRTVMEGLTCYQEMYKEKKRAAKQPTIRAFFQPVAAMVIHEGEKIMSDEPVPSTSRD